MVVNVGHDHLTVTTNISYLERKNRESDRREHLQLKSNRSDVDLNNPDICDILQV